jgi:hypothetical protein
MQNSSDAATKMASWRWVPAVLLGLVGWAAVLAFFGQQVTTAEGYVEGNCKTTDNPSPNTSWHRCPWKRRAVRGPCRQRQR